MPSRRKVTLEEVRAVVEEDLEERMAKLRADGKRAPLLSECLREVGTPAGRALVAAVLAGGPFPQFAAAAGRPGVLVKIDKDGTRTLGRFVRRTFAPVKGE